MWHTWLLTVLRHRNESCTRGRICDRQLSQFYRGILSWCAIACPETTLGGLIPLQTSAHGHATAALGNARARQGAIHHKLQVHERPLDVPERSSDICSHRCDQSNSARGDASNATTSIHYEKSHFQSCSDYR
jgi:hypothetical protein